MPRDPVPGVEGERPTSAVWPLVLAVTAVALVLRCLHVWQIQHSPFFDVRVGDGEAYHLWARRIADGGWFGSEVFYQSPLYPYFLAVIYRLFDDSTATVRLIQAFFGAASCGLLAAAGALCFGRLGVLAGLGLAIYPPAIFLDGLIDKSALVTFFSAALLAILSLPADRLDFRRCLGIGLVLGLLALARENALLLAAPVMLWIILGPPFAGVRRRLVPACAFVAGCSLILLPVGFRNLVVGGEFHLTTSQFGHNFYIGNHAGADGSYEPLVVGHGNVVDERDDATRLAEQAAGRKLGPGEVSHYWTKRALDYIASQPADWLKLTARKLALTFNTAEVSDTESQDVYAQCSWLLRILAPFDFALLLGMATFGAALTISRWRRLWFLYALVATYSLSVVIFYVFARYRFPVVPVLLLLAAGGMAEVFGLARLPRLRTMVAPLVAAVLAFAFAHLPLDNPRIARAAHYSNVANVLSKDPQRYELAIDFYKRALNVDPRLPSAQAGLGELLVRMGRPKDAIPYYRAAVASSPEYTEARYNFAVALAAAGQTLEAAQEYTEVLRLRPDHADAEIALAKTFIALQRPDLAVEHYRKGLALQPKNTQALVGLGVALTQLNRPEEAIQNYRLALEIDPQHASAHNNFGWTLATQGRIAEALAHFERALALKPDYEDARRNLDEARQTLSNPPNK